MDTEIDEMLRERVNRLADQIPPSGVDANADLARARHNKRRRDAAVVTATAAATACLVVVVGVLSGAGPLARHVQPASGGASAAVPHRAIDEHGVRCFAAASLDSSTLFMDASNDVRPNVGTKGHPQTGPMPDPNPIGLCASTWRNGLMPTHAHPRGINGRFDLARHPQAVPPLVACVLPANDTTPDVGVFPGPPGTCRTLGLPIAPNTTPRPASPASPKVDINPQ